MLPPSWILVLKREATSKHRIASHRICTAASWDTDTPVSRSVFCCFTSNTKTKGEKCVLEKRSRQVPKQPYPVKEPGFPRGKRSHKRNLQPVTCNLWPVTCSPWPLQPKPNQSVPVGAQHWKSNATQSSPPKNNKRNYENVINVKRLIINKKYGSNLEQLSRLAAINIKAKTK